MDRLETLLGSETRANVLRVLCGSEAPLSAYRVAIECNMNVAKVYGEMKRLAAAGLIVPRKGRGGTVYSLEDGDLRSLVSRLSVRMVSYSSWSSARERAKRFRAGMREVPRFELGEPSEGGAKPRLRGELANLARLGRAGFDSKHRKTGERAYARL